LTTENQLLPCPFCGTAPRTRIEQLSERYAYAERVICECPNCGCAQSAIGDTSKGGYADNSTVKSRANAAWNRRTAQPAEGGEPFDKWFEGHTKQSRMNGGQPDYFLARDAWGASRQSAPPASQEQAQQPSIASAADMAVYQSIADGYPKAQQPSGGEVARLAQVALDEAGSGPKPCDWMEAALKVCRHVVATPKPEPMTDDEMWALWNSQGIDDMTQHEAIAFARAVEAHHGITKGSESAACSVCEGKGHVYRDGRCVGFCRCPAGRNALALNIPPAPITKEQA